MKITKQLTKKIFGDLRRNELILYSTKDRELFLVCLGLYNALDFLKRLEFDDRGVVNPNSDNYYIFIQPICLNNGLTKLEVGIGHACDDTANQSGKGKNMQDLLSVLSKLCSRSHKKLIYYAYDNKNNKIMKFNKVEVQTQKEINKTLDEFETFEFTPQGYHTITNLQV